MNLISLCSFLFRERLLGTVLSDLVMVQGFQRLSKSMSSEPQTVAFYTVW